MKALPETASKEEWIERRKTSIGSSEISTVLGLNPYKSPLQLWCEKTGRVEPVKDNPYMAIGRALEPVVADLFKEKTGLNIRYVGKTYRHETLDYATAIPDFWITDESESPVGILECKTTHFYKAGDWEAGDIPALAHCQIIWQMGVTGITNSHVACLAGADPNKFYHKEILFEPSIWEQMTLEAAKFIGMVRSDTPPSATRGDIKLLDKIAKANKEIKVLDAQALALIEEFEKYGKDKKQAEEAVERIQEKIDDTRARLVQMLDGSSIGTCGEWRVVNKQTKRASYMVKATEYRAFSIKKHIGE